MRKLLCITLLLLLGINTTNAGIFSLDVNNSPDGNGSITTNVVNGDNVLVDATAQTGNLQEAENMADVGYLPYGQQDKTSVTIRIMSGSKLTIGSEGLNTFDHIRLEIHSSSEGQLSIPGCFFSERPITFSNSQIVIHEDAQFVCSEEVTLADSEIIFAVSSYDQPTFVVKDLNINGTCWIKISDGKKLI